MKKLCLLMIVMIGCAGLSFGQASATEHAAGETVIFRFLPQDDGFYLTVHKNNDEFVRLLDLVSEYKAEIMSGDMPVNVTSYSSALATAKANMASAKIRANRVKSELIVRRGLVEENFRTVNKATKYEGQPSVVIVKMTIPMKKSAATVGEEKVRTKAVETRISAEEEAQLKIREAELRAREAELRAREAELKAREAELRALEAEAKAAARMDEKELKAKKKKDLKIEKEQAKIEAREEAAEARAVELKAKAAAKEAEAIARAQAMALEEAMAASAKSEARAGKEPGSNARSYEEVKAEEQKPEATTVKTLKEVEPDEKVVLRPDIFVKPDRNGDEYEPVISKTWGKPYWLAARTNLLYWLAGVPNAGVDIRLGGPTALVINGAWTHLNWDNDQRTYRISMLNPEFRWYLGTCRNWYTGVSGNIGRFNFKFDDAGHQGDYYGGGALVGYQTNLSRHLFLDFKLGIGYMRADFDKYGMTDTDARYAVDKDQVMHYFGPTQAGVSLIWTIGQTKRNQ